MGDGRIVAVLLLDDRPDVPPERAPYEALDQGYRTLPWCLALDRPVRAHRSEGLDFGDALAQLVEVDAERKVRRLFRKLTPGCLYLSAKLGEYRPDVDRIVLFHR